MSEYWVSNAKHFCRFCKIYITDNKSTRNIHDSGSKHKENVERFLREQGQRGRDKELEQKRLEKSMQEIEEAARKQYELDIQAGFLPSASSKPATATGGKKITVPTTPSTATASSLATTESKEATTPAAETTTAITDQKEVESATKLETDTTADSVTKEQDTEEAEELKPTAPKRDETVGQPGAWETVVVHNSLSTSVSSGSSKSKKNQDEDDEEGGDSGNALRQFKIVEKEYPTEASSPFADEKDTDQGEIVFKKRKAGAAKTRNIRRKV